VSGHLGLVAELAAQGRDVVADYAVNVFNQHSAAEVFRLGARRIVMSVELTDPAGYVFPVATDYACRNRLLHSRPVDGSTYLPGLWRDGFRNFRLVFNVPGDPVARVTAAYRASLDDLAEGRTPDPGAV